MNYLKKINISGIKFGKIALVIFLTALIWVWTDLSLDEELPVSNATIMVAKTDPNLWVSLDGKASVNINDIVLKGPASKTSEVNRKLKTGLLRLEFFLDAGQEEMDQPGEYSLDVPGLLRKSDQIRELGLAVQSCEPNKLTVSVVELDKRSLDIECFDENGTPLVGVKSIEPSKVDMYVPADSRLKAQVKLTRTEIVQARSTGAVTTPYVVLAQEQMRYATTSVTIKISPEADPLSPHTITGAKLVTALSMNLQGKFKVDVTNYENVVSQLTILATDEAKEAYENQPVHMTLYILDSDAKKGPEEVIQRKVVYNFPEEFVRRNEIRLQDPQQAAEAKFKMIPLTSTEIPATGPG